MVKLITAVLIAVLSVFGGVYADTGLIMDQPTDTVCVTMQNGNEFEFLASEGDWFEGDLVSVLFYDNGTPTVTDDIIIRTKYSGWIEDASNWLK